jgi:hypothetical protein
MIPFSQWLDERRDMTTDVRNDFALLTNRWMPDLKQMAGRYRPFWGPALLMVWLAACPAAEPPAASVLIPYMQSMVEQFRTVVANAPDTERKIMAIDEGLSVLRSLAQTNSLLREKTWNLAYRFTEAEPLQLLDREEFLEDVEYLKLIAEGLIKFIPIEPEFKQPIRFVVKAMLDVFVFFTEGMTRSFESLANGMHRANLQSLTLAEMKNPVYPGLTMSECLAAYQQIIHARTLVRELDATGCLVGDFINELIRMKQALQQVDQAHHAWVRRVAQAVDGQIQAANFQAGTLDGLETEMIDLVQAAKDLTPQDVLDYTVSTEETIQVARQGASEGAQVMFQLNELEKQLETAGQILSACERYQIDVAFHRRQYQKDHQDFENVMKNLASNTASLIQETNYPPHALEEALAVKDLYGAQLTARSQLDRYGQRIPEWLAIPALLERVTPATALISLPLGISFPYKIPLQVKVLNVLGNPIPGVRVEFLGRGEAQGSPVAANTDSAGVAAGEITVWGGVLANPVGTSVEASVLEAGRTVRLDYAFAQAGNPSALVTLSRPQSPGMPGAILPDAWVVTVQDNQGNTVNNRSLAVQFEALDGGGITAEKTETQVSPGDIIPVDQVQFRALITLGMESGKEYRFRVRLTNPAEFTVSQEITVTADQNSTYGSAIVTYPTRFTFSFTPNALAQDLLTAEVTGRPQFVPYNTYVWGVSVERLKCEHYRVYNVTNAQGEVTTVRELEFAHPYDSLSSEGHLAQSRPEIRPKNEGVVKVDQSAMQILALKAGQTDVQAKIQGIIGYEKTHTNCSRTVVRLGPITNELPVRVVRIKEVAYLCGESGDHFFLQRSPDQTYEESFGVSAQVSVTDESKVESFHSKNSLRLAITTDPGMTSSVQSPNQFTGAIQGLLKGLGTARILAYLQDSKGVQFRPTEAGIITLNQVSYTQDPWLVPAGDLCRLALLVKGGADMYRYVCPWFLTNSFLASSLRSTLSTANTSFHRTGSGQWETVNYLQYREDAVEPLSAVPSPGFDGDLWSYNIIEMSGTPETPNTWYAVRLWPARLNHVQLLAKRPAEAGYPVRAFRCDLFSEKPVSGKANNPLLQVLAQGVFGKSIERPLSTYVRWSLGDSAYEKSVEICTYSMRSEETLVELNNYNDPDGYYCLRVARIKKPGITSLSALVNQDDLDDLYPRQPLKEGATTVFSDNRLDLFVNWIHLEHFLENNRFLFRLVIDGPSPMFDYRTRWTFRLPDQSTVIDILPFLQSSDGLWYCERDEVTNATDVTAEILDGADRVVGQTTLSLTTATRLVVSAPSRVGTDPGTFTADLLVYNVTNLSTYRIYLAFDPSILEAVQVLERNFLPGTGTTMFESTIDSTRGQVMLSGSKRLQQDPQTGETTGMMSGSGTLASIVFRNRQAGQSLLEFTNSYLYQPGTINIPCVKLKKLVEIEAPAAAAQALVIPRVLLPPKIDGILDDRWNMMPAQPLNRVVKGTITGPTDLSATWRALCDDKYLYLAFEVKDEKLMADSPSSEPWQDDSVEVFLDLNNQKTAVYDGLNDYQFSWAINQWGGPPVLGINSRDVDVTGFLNAGQTNPTGYTWETAIPWAAVGVRPLAGYRLGIEVQVNDDDDGYDSDAALAWNQQSYIAWEDPSSFGVADVSEQPVGASEWTQALDALVAERGLPVEAALGTADPDGDRWANLAEFALGASPIMALDPANVHDLFRIAAAPQGAIVLIMPLANRPDVEYVLESSPVLDTGSWAPMARKNKQEEWTSLLSPGAIEFVTDTNGFHIQIHDLPQSAVFWRLQFKP